jgi:cytochrome c oxidase subunit III
MAHAHVDTPPDLARYYVPHGTHWPIIGSFALFFLLGGAALYLNELAAGKVSMIVGFLLLLVMLFGWFGTVIKESEGRYYNSQVDTSFRMGMIWFIFSEVMFFAAFFGALWYARTYATVWLGGAGDGAMTNEYLWPQYTATWPTNGPANIGGAFETIPAYGLPLINTLLLLASGVTITIAHHALRAGQRGKLLFWLGATIALGVFFLYFQVSEYAHAYHELNLTLGSGVYGSTFFMLTGFHGMHVTLGAIMLTVIWFRCARGHFTREHHFGFEAVAWYWHFVDVVWLGLFLFVYVI